jgi:hypothetical protein
MTITTLLSGDLLGTIAFAQTNTQLCHYIVIYTVVSYIVISVHMNVVRRFGGVVAVLLATGRKGMTLVLSFILFPKAFSWYYVMGAVLVLGGLLLSTLVVVKNNILLAGIVGRYCWPDLETTIYCCEDLENNSILLYGLGYCKTIYC